MNINSGEIFGKHALSLIQETVHPERLSALKTLFSGEPFFYTCKSITGDHFGRNKIVLAALRNSDNQADPAYLKGLWHEICFPLAKDSNLKPENIIGEIQSLSHGVNSDELLTAFLEAEKKEATRNLLSNLQSKAYKFGTNNIGETSATNLDYHSFKDYIDYLKNLTGHDTAPRTSYATEQYNLLKDQPEFTALANYFSENLTDLNYKTTSSFDSSFAEKTVNDIKEILGPKHHASKENIPLDHRTVDEYRLNEELVNRFFRKDPRLTVTQELDNAPTLKAYLDSVDYTKTPVLDGYNITPAQYQKKLTLTMLEHLSKYGSHEEQGMVHDLVEKLLK